MCYKNLQALVPIAQYSKQGATLNIAKIDSCVGHLISPGLPTAATSPQVTSHSYLGKCFQGQQYGSLICLFLKEASVHIVDICLSLTGYEGGHMASLNQRKVHSQTVGVRAGQCRGVQVKLRQWQGSTSALISQVQDCGKPLCTP